MDALRELAAANPSVHELLGDLARAVVDAAEVPRHDPDFPGLSDNRIADEPDDASTKGKPMRRVHGPYRHYDRWRIKIVDRTTGKVANETFPTEEEARVAMAAFRRRNARESGIGIREALGLYERYLGEKGNKRRSIETTSHRLRNLFGPVLKIAVVALTPTGAAKLYDGLTAKDGSPIAIDTRRNALNQGKTFLKWCKSKGHSRINALEDVQGVGKRRRGKPQLTIDEARRFLAKAIELTEGGDDGAVAAAMALLMGMRGSEIAERIVRNLDDGGRILWITDAKTQAGIRRLRVPQQLQPWLLRLAENQPPSRRIFGSGANRHWVLRQVHRICKAAGVPVVPAHGLRGTHATLAVPAGATGDVVAAALGHESFTTTARHYARPEAIDSATQDHALRELEKSSRGFPRSANDTAGDRRLA